MQKVILSSEITHDNKIMQHCHCRPKVDCAIHMTTAWSVLHWGRRLESGLSDEVLSINTLFRRHKCEDNSANIKQKQRKLAPIDTGRSPYHVTSFGSSSCALIRRRFNKFSGFVFCRQSRCGSFAEGQPAFDGSRLSQDRHIIWFVLDHHRTRSTFQHGPLSVGLFTNSDKQQF